MPGLSEGCAVKLTKAHREVLTLIADRTGGDLSDGLADPGWTISSATFADSYNVFVHWRTARALHARGLIGYPYKGGYEEGWSIALTAKGWAVLGRTPPADLVLPTASSEAS